MFFTNLFIKKNKQQQRMHSGRCLITATQETESERLKVPDQPEKYSETLPHHKNKKDQGCI